MKRFDGKGRGTVNMEKMETLVRDAVNDADLRPHEIPGIDLYLDQILSLADAKRRAGSERFYDRELTKTMINNYSKDGLIEPIKGKKYSRDQILQMLLVYSLKNTLSMGEIKRILQNTYSLEAYNSEMLEDVYGRFLAIKDDARANAWMGVTDFLEREELDVEKESDFLTLLLGLSAMSSYLKNIVQALLEEHYIYPDERREMEKRERKEEAARIKEEKKAEKKAEKAKAEESVENMTADPQGEGE